MPTHAPTQCDEATHPLLCGDGMGSNVRRAHAVNLLPLLGSGLVHKAIQVQHIQLNREGAHQPLSVAKSVTQSNLSASYIGPTHSQVFIGTNDGNVNQRLVDFVGSQGLERGRHRLACMP